MYSKDPVFCQNLFGLLFGTIFGSQIYKIRGPQSVTVTNFIILTALFQAVTGTRPWLRFYVTERNREPTFLGLHRPLLGTHNIIYKNISK